MTDYEQISKQAEAELNTKSTRTGERGINTLDEGGANSAFAEKKFDTAEVVQGDELSTNQGYNKRIPPSEGGILDDRGRQARGQHFEGKGGPLDKIEHTGHNDNDAVPARVPKVDGLASARDIATQGQAASESNVGRKPPGPGGQKFKGENYYEPESVPGSISAGGYESPGSVVEASQEAEQPENFRSR